MPHFLFPSDPLDPRRADEHFASQSAALRGAGFSASLVSDRVFDDGAPLTNLPAGEVVYRGWMVNGAQYANFIAAVERSGSAPITSASQYLLAHHLPKWYPLLRDLTPETVVYAEDVDLETELRKLGWSGYFIKDYVKSLKTSRGSRITDPAEAGRVVEDMRRFRGAIEGGICVRRVEDFVASTEVRYFVLRGRAYGPDGQTPPVIVETVAERIDHPFFSVDVIATTSGVLRVVEIGDGQVSDLVGWSAESFVRIWRNGIA